MKIAIIHDYLNQFGGAERVVEVLHEIFPEAPIYTSIYLKDRMPKSFESMDIRTSYMQKFPFLDTQFKKYLLFYPRAIESFKLDQYDLILSSSSAFAKGATVNKNTCHICYCYTPMRFVWNYEDYIEKEKFNKFILKILPLTIRRLKKWDLGTNENVNSFIAISEYINKRIKRCYGRNSEVIYPPVSVTKYKSSCKIEDYFLIVSRLNAYKNIDLIIRTFNELGYRLKIVGSGPYRNNLEKISRNKNIEFLGKVTDEDLIKIYSKCRAFIFPGIEDFGIAPVEAQAAGRPVIAYGSGGALETVIENITGVFFKENTTSSVIEAIRRFEGIESSFEQKKITRNAHRFDEKVFKRKLRSTVLREYEEFNKNR